MNRSFLKYIGCAFAVLAGVAVVDKVAGAGMNRLLDAVPVTQDIGKGRFAIREVETDVVIVGSSRAAYHYVSTMIADSLGFSVYNVGRDGCFFSDNLCVTNSILDRYSPKMVIIEVANDCLSENAITRPEAMYPYYYESDYIKDVICSDIGWKAEVQMLSTLYRYNSTSFKMLGYGLNGLISGKVEDPLYGQKPLPVAERRVPLQLERKGDEGQKSIVSNQKRTQLKELLVKGATQNVMIVLVCSPYFMKFSEDDLGSLSLKKLCSETGAVYLDFSQEQMFLKHPEWFNDRMHMNTNGAIEYTRVFINEIKSMFFKNDVESQSL